MNRDTLADTLEDAGLSPYQADAFVTLLERGSASATDIAKASSVPDARIYDVLRDLEEDGYIETYEQDSLHARAHDPSDVLSDLRARADRFNTAADEIEDRWSRPALEDHKVSIVKRLDTVLARTDELIRSAEDQVKIAVTIGQFDELSDALAAAYERGVNVKVCLSTMDDDPSLPDDSVFETTCTEARYRKLPSPFLALIDRSWACFSPHGRSTDQYSIIVNDLTYAYVFHWYFLTGLWEFHESVYSERRDGEPITYVDMRQCVRDIEPLLEDGASIEATVHGFDTETGRELTLEGTITDATYAGINAADEREATISQLAGKVSITLETDGGTYTVGGWSALLEDVEATKITIGSLE
ncbi:transcriptional regulator, TrmB (plasmid) [Halostagnicola larsenii XH-48]|uniref:Transcriptional regulator, TrmB n=1 Tax=Halostagnicola larsenii XH-48 TaxID=797299 RepID=W0JWI7_9EURY|nr:TrmB family transcriptional regulator [Halostagnicola larsenii]AHG01610.1 transcriptional regulator, TrmB [Halostagnicola larsenii XH-48]